MGKTLWTDKTKDCLIHPMTNKPDLSAAYALQTPDDSKRLYAEWANSYDSDFARGQDYILHLHVAQVFAQSGGIGPVLDIGAGTGLCGEALNRHGTTDIDGTDISPEMLNVARSKGVYNALFEGNILEKLPVSGGHYNGIVSSGTFTTGHVGPEGLDEVIRIAAQGALVALSVNAQHYKASGFEEKLAQLGDLVSDLILTEVQIYGETATDAHKDDTALIVQFRRA
jgi:predicted TPR repeat methyltransferase